MRLYGLEFFLLPLLSCAYLFAFTDFTWPGALFNNCIVTGASAGVAFWRQRTLADWASKKGDRAERYTPVGPFFAALVLSYLTALQLIAAVTHLSYYRKGSAPLVADLFDK